jgi:hypothetical protein
MGARKALRARVESLESKTVMSAALATAPTAVVSAFHETALVKPAPLDNHALSMTPTANGESPFARRLGSSLTLSGSADGDYTATLSPHGAATKYHLSATGTITPIGSAVVRGSIHTPGSKPDSQASGTLTIVGSQGMIKLKLTPASSVIADASVNPGRPMMRATTSAVSDPIILVHYFEFTITAGTGQYAHDRGTGTAVITTSPGTTTLPGPGIYSSPSTPQTGSGTTALTFSSGPIPI